METKLLSGRLTCWQMKLGDFDFNVKYKKRHLNTQAVVLSRVRTLGDAGIPVENETPCLSLET